MRARSTIDWSQSNNIFVSVCVLTDGSTALVYRLIYKIKPSLYDISCFRNFIIF